MKKGYKYVSVIEKNSLASVKLVEERWFSSVHHIWALHIFTIKYIQSRRLILQKNRLEIVKEIAKV